MEKGWIAGPQQIQGDPKCNSCSYESNFQSPPVCWLVHFLFIGVKGVSHTIHPRTGTQVLSSLITLARSFVSLVFILEKIGKIDWNWPKRAAWPHIECTTIEGAAEECGVHDVWDWGTGHFTCSEWCQVRVPCFCWWSLLKRSGIACTLEEERHS